MQSYLLSFIFYLFIFKNNLSIVKIKDITDEVKRIKQSIANGTFKKSFLPEEKEYIIK